MTRKSRISIIVLEIMTALIILIIYTNHVIKIVKQVPELDSFKIDLSMVKGRKMPKNQIKPGTFTINEIFESIVQHTDSLLVFSEFNDIIKIQIWRPDPTLKGMFQYAYKTYFVKDYWNSSLYKVGEIIKTETGLKILPNVDWFEIILGYVQVLTYLFCAAIISFFIFLFNFK